MAPSSPGAGFTLPDNVVHLNIRLFLAYWLSKCRGERLPGRHDLDPLEMKAFLPYVALIDVLHEADDRLRFRFRLVGTHATRLNIDDLTGQYVDERLPPDGYAKAYERFAAVVLKHQPVYGVSPVPWPGHDFETYEHLDLPLAGDGRKVDMLFCWRYGVPRKGSEYFTHGL